MAHHFFIFYLSAISMFLRSCKGNRKSIFSTNSLRKEVSKIKEPLLNKGSEAVICGPAWARTMDPLIMSQVL